jgi:large subunit ribosomal protein L19e
MKLAIQKKLAAKVFDCSAKRVWFDEDRLEEIKEAITKSDIKGLVGHGLIRLKPQKSQSRGRIRQNKAQRAKGLRKGHGSRKGKFGARGGKKEAWVKKIRTQRKFIAEILERESITNETYRILYRKCKGGFFRSVRHIKLFAEEQGLFKK